MSDTIQVCLRVRPPLPREKNERFQIHWRYDDTRISQNESKNSSGNTYIFDKIFGLDSDNKTIFEHIKPIIESSVKGYHGTIFAYGQTSSGKTFTMMGNKGESGIIPQALDYIFQCIDDTADRTYLLRASYMEIYNEIITDLLAEKLQNSKEASLKIYEDASGLPCVSELKEEFIKDKQEAIKLIKKGELNRHIGNTLMNEKSSRSHTIFRMIIESRPKDEDGAFDPNCAFMVSHLNLVDLAGSEKTANVATSATRFKEGCAINLSLLQLSQVISKLSEGDGSFVNYRNSNLTRILKPSLGGNAKTAVICTVSPVVIEETLSTLKFADRAKKVKNKPIVNSTVSEGPLLKKYEREIQALKVQIEKEKHQSKHMLALEEQLEKKDDKIFALENKIKTMQTKMVVSSQCTPKHLAFSKKNNRRETWCAPLAMRRGGMGTSILKSLIDFPEEISLSTEKKEKHEIHRNSYPELVIENPNSQPMEEDASFENSVFEDPFVPDMPVRVSSEETVTKFQEDILHLKEQLSELQFKLLSTEKENEEFRLSNDHLKSELAKEVKEKEDLEIKMSDIKKDSSSSEALFKQNGEQKQEVCFLKKRLEEAKQELADFLKEATAREESDAEEIRRLKSLKTEVKPTAESNIKTEILQNDIQNLKTELEASKTLLLKNQQNKLSLQKELQEHETNAKGSKLTIESLQKEIQDLKMEMNSSKTTALKQMEMDLFKQLQEYETKAKEQEEKFQCLMNENRELKECMENIRSQLNQEENKNLSLTAEIHNLKTKCNSEQKIASKMSSVEMRELQDKIKELEDDLNRKEKYNQTLEERYLQEVINAQNNDMTAKEFKNKMTFAIEKEEKLREEMKSVRKQLDLQEFENQDLKQELKGVVDYQMQRQEEYSELNRKYMKAENDLTDWRRRNALINEQQEALNAIHNKYERIMREQGNELIKLRKENMIYQVDAKSIREIMENVKEDNNKKHKTNCDLHTFYLKKVEEVYDQLEKNKNSLYEKRQLIIDTKYNEEEVRMQLTDEQKAHLSTQTKLKKIEKENAAKIKNLEAAIEELKTALVTKPPTSSNNSHLCSSKDCKAIAELNEAELKICELYDVLDQEKRKFNRKIRDLECEGFVKDDKIIELEKCVSSDVETLTKEIKSLKAQIAKYKTELFHKSTELNEIQIKLGQGEAPFKEKIESLQKDIAYYMEKISHLKNENRRLSQQSLDSTVFRNPGKSH